MNHEAYDAMRAAEDVYLRANGWAPEEGAPGFWVNTTYRTYGVVQGHAVNIQKQHDRRSK
jgi:hypothetical protein